MLDLIRIYACEAPNAAGAGRLAGAQPVTAPSEALDTRREYLASAPLR
jgi:hypothetical protein